MADGLHPLHLSWIWGDKVPAVWLDKGVKEMLRIYSVPSCWWEIQAQIRRRTPWGWSQLPRAAHPHSTAPLSYDHFIHAGEEVNS